MQASEGQQPDAQALQAAAAFDRGWQSMVARFTGGVSPASQHLAWADWVWQLGLQPARAWHLATRAGLAATQALASASRGDEAPPEPGYAHEGWSMWPFSGARALHEAALRWWDESAALPGVSPAHRRQVRFLARQALEAWAPAHLPFGNPELAQRTVSRLGGNLVDGARIAHDNLRARIGLPPANGKEADAPPLRPGVDLALTPGKVVHRNHLVELIRYAPTTPRVHAEPVFIVPSWIMKFYILDLSPHNSMVRWLVDQGHTVYILSWRNPDENDALLGLHDYLDLGLLDSLDAIGRAHPGEQVHACGYCLGGTLLVIAAAGLAGRSLRRHAARLPTLRSLTLLAAETDFSEPGEIGVLIDEAQVTWLENQMAERGFLTGRQMADSFSFLHPRELVWSRLFHETWLGESTQANDLMAWNADVTRMPAAMHSEYLRRCYLGNEIALDLFPVQGHPVSLADLRLPVFVVGTERDHVAPWHSVYRLHRLTAAEIQFVLTSGGHNAGILSEPGHPGRHYLTQARPAGHGWVPPDEWQAAARREEGSWWPAWSAWLVARGSGRWVEAVAPDAALPDAPGEYVQVRYPD